MLSRYLGVAELPIYEIAYTASMRVRSLAESALRALLPTISSIGANLNKQAVNKILGIYRRSIKLIFIFCVPLYLFLLVAAPFLLKIWLGEKFVETLPFAFQLMLIGSFLSLLSVPAYYTFMGINKPHYCLISHLIQSFSNFIIITVIVIFIHTFHVQDVVLAVVLGMSLSSFQSYSQSYE
jgi:O-antigen/teichoic acid export membrane protein